MDAKPEKKRDYEERMLFCSCCCLAIVEGVCVCLPVCVCVRLGGVTLRIGIGRLSKLVNTDATQSGIHLSESL